MTTYRPSDDDEHDDAATIATDDRNEMPLGAAIDYLERLRGELPDDRDRGERE